jgi:hypothetical protein
LLRCQITPGKIPPQIRAAALAFLKVINSPFYYLKG